MSVIVDLNKQPGATVLLHWNKQCTLSGKNSFHFRAGIDSSVAVVSLLRTLPPQFVNNIGPKVCCSPRRHRSILTAEQPKWCLKWLSTAPGGRRGRCGCWCWWACLCASVCAEHPHLRRTVPWRTSLPRKKLRRATGRTARTCSSSSCCSPSPSSPSGSSNTGASGSCTKLDWRWFMVRCSGVTWETSSVSLLSCWGSMISC